MQIHRGKRVLPEMQIVFKLVRNYKTGKYFLRCSNNRCGNTKPLDPRLIKWYISQEDVMCPKHNCPVTLHSGQFGQYLRCEYGHTLKLTEI